MNFTEEFCSFSDARKVILHTKCSSINAKYEEQIAFAIMILQLFFYFDELYSSKADFLCTLVTFKKVGEIIIDCDHTMLNTKSIYRF